MKRLKSFIKYMSITIVTILLIAFTLIVVHFFYTNAPITKGKVSYNIIYKPKLKLDLYEPTKKVYKKSPIVFYVHGGAWIIGDKFTLNNNRFNAAINSLREQGYTIICPNYTLGKKGKSPFPDCIKDIEDAIHWTKKNAPQYNLDTQNMGLLGESAGAQIALMLAFGDNHLENRKQDETTFNYLIDVYGPSDLSSIYNGPEIKNLNNRLNKFLNLTSKKINIEEYVFGFNPKEDINRTKYILEHYSPIKFLRKKNFPTLIIHGKKDQIVAVEQSLKLSYKMDSLGIANEMHLIEGMDHSFRKATQKQKENIQILITDFVIKNYKYTDLTLN